MKVASLTIVHYGKDHLRWALQSVRNHVSESVVLYTDRPSHGGSTTLVCPDTEEQLKSEAWKGVGHTTLKWISKRWGSEGDHRDAVWSYTDADMIVVVDADEFWPEPYLKHAIEYAKNAPQQRFLVRMIHFWRSFGLVCRDEMMPVRIIKREGSGNGYIPNLDGEVPSKPFVHSMIHFGYARKPEDISYKLKIHGHRAEWKDGWFENVFMKWPPGEMVHPTCDIWNPEPFDRGRLPAALSDHPYLNMEPIQ